MAGLSHSFLKALAKGERHFDPYVASPGDSSQSTSLQDSQETVAAGAPMGACTEQLSQTSCASTESLEWKNAGPSHWRPGNAKPPPAAAEFFDSRGRPRKRLAATSPCSRQRGQEVADIRALYGGRLPRGRPPLRGSQQQAVQQFLFEPIPEKYLSPLPVASEAHYGSMQRAFRCT